MEKNIDRLSWIRDLVMMEERMEESGLVDMNLGYDNDRVLATETLRFLEQLKEAMIDATNTFNEMKSLPLGRIKVYGIAKTQADFMLFRNGFKMIFTLKQPGVIGIRFNFLGPNHYMTQAPSMIPQKPGSDPMASQGAGATSLMEENLLIAKKGAFQELIWTFQDAPINVGAMIRYHLSLFIRESAK